MSKYKGLFTFNVDNHRYVPVEQADGLISDMNYHPEPEEEPKVGYIIDPMEEDCVSADDSGYEEPDVERAKELGIWFKTKEKTEKAVKKLKAWKRLRGKGFRFANCEIEMSEIIVPEITIKAFVDTEEPETLNLVNLLLGGEE